MSVNKLRKTLYTILDKLPKDVINLISDYNQPTYLFFKAEFNTIIQAFVAQNEWVEFMTTDELYDQADNLTGKLTVTRIGTDYIIVSRGNRSKQYIVNISTRKAVKMSFIPYFATLGEIGFTPFTTSLRCTNLETEKILGEYQNYLVYRKLPKVIYSKDWLAFFFNLEKGVGFGCVEAKTRMCIEIAKLKDDIPLFIIGDLVVLSQVPGFINILNRHTKSWDSYRWPIPDISNRDKNQFHYDDETQTLYMHATLTGNIYSCKPLKPNGHFNVDSKWMLMNCGMDDEDDYY